MPATVTDPNAIRAIIAEDPQIQAALAEVEEMRAAGVPVVASSGSAQPSLTRWAQDNLVPLLQAKGITQMPHDFGISLGANGNRVGDVNRRGFWDRNSDWLVPAIIGGMGAGAGALASAGTSAAGAGGASGASGLGTGTLAATTPALSTGTLASTVTPALGAGGAGGSMAAGGWGSLLSNLASNPETYATLASSLGRMGEGMAGERGAENMAALTADQLRNSQFNTEQTAATRAKDAEERAALDRAQLGIAAPTARTRQALLGSLIQNIQPVSFENTGRVQVPTMRGGLTPVAISEATRGAGGELERQAIDALLSGSDVPAATDFQSARLTPPSLTPYQQPGAGESVLSGIGAAGNTFNTVMENLRRQQQPRNTFTPSPELGYEGG